MDSVFGSSAVDRIKLVVVASRLSTQH